MEYFVSFEDIDDDAVLEGMIEDADGHVVDSFPIIGSLDGTMVWIDDASSAFLRCRTPAAPASLSLLAELRDLVGEEPGFEAVIEDAQHRYLMSRPLSGPSGRLPLALSGREFVRLASARVPVAGRLEGSRIRLPLLLPATWRDRASPFVPRVGPTDVRAASGVVAGGAHVGVPPVNGVGTTYTTRYLVLPVDIGTGGGWKDGGTVIEMETHWEPLGWALDEWISTESFSPYEDSLLSSAAISTDGSVQQDSAGSDEAASSEAARSTSVTGEVMRLAANSFGTSRGAQIGVGADRSRTSSFTLDPISSLVQAVTGTIQLGFSSGSTSQRMESSGELRKELSAGVQHAASQLRSTSSSLLVGARNTLDDRRRLDAVRNGSGRAMNVVTHAVVRQWLVSTIEARRRPVVFIPIRQLDEAFTPANVFDHLPALDGALLDPSLRPALFALAADFVPEDVGVQATAPSVAGTAGVGPGLDEIRRVQARITVLRAPKDTSFTIVLIFAEGRRISSEPHRVQAGSCTIDVDVDGAETVGSFLGAHLRYRSNKRLGAEVAMVGAVEVVALLGDEHSVLLVSDIEPQSVGDDTEVPLRSVVLVANDQERRRAVDAARILHHLGTNCAYYRMAVDLQADSLSRYRRLSEATDRNDLPMPADMGPVGVAAAHLVFLVDAEDEPREPGEPDREVVSTPASGTFAELLLSNGALRGLGAELRPKLPTAAAWPAPFQPAPPQSLGSISPSGTLPAAPALPGEPATAATDALKALLASLTELATKAAAPALPAAGADAGKGGGDGGDGGDGGADEPTPAPGGAGATGTPSEV